MDPNEVFSLTEGEELTLETAVYQTVGAASTCWENLSGTGVFQDGQAKRIAENLISAIREGKISEFVHVRNMIARADALDQRRQEQIANQKASIDRLISAAGRLQNDLDEMVDRQQELVEALRLTAEYVGQETLPAIPGWSWYDALLKYAPAIAARFSQTGPVPGFDLRTASVLPLDTPVPPVLEVWAVVFGDYNPMEVDTLHATEELALARLAEIPGVRWKVVKAEVQQ